MIGHISSLFLYSIQIPVFDRGPPITTIRPRNKAYSLRRCLYIALQGLGIRIILSNLIINWLGPKQSRKKSKKRVISCLNLEHIKVAKTFIFQVADQEYSKMLEKRIIDSLALSAFFPATYLGEYLLCRPMVLRIYLHYRHFLRGHWR